VPIYAKDFRDLLVERVEAVGPSLKAMGYRQLVAFELGRSGYKLSVQASGMHYCEPRELLDLRKYSAMEIALLDPSGKLCPPLLSLPEEIRALWESSRSPVAGYVPVETIQKIVDLISEMLPMDPNAPLEF